MEVIQDKEFVRKTVKSVRNKWSKQTRYSNGYFVRHLDGDATNDCLLNGAWVHPYDALEHIDDWTTDILCDLSDEEAEFVKANSKNLMTFYEKRRKLSNK